MVEGRQVYRLMVEIYFDPARPFSRNIFFWSFTIVNNLKLLITAVSFQNTAIMSAFLWDQALRSMVEGWSVDSLMVDISLDQARP